MLSWNSPLPVSLVTKYPPSSAGLLLVTETDTRSGFVARPQPRESPEAACIAVPCECGGICSTKSRTFSSPPLSLSASGFANGPFPTFTKKRPAASSKSCQPSGHLLLEKATIAPAGISAGMFSTDQFQIPITAMAMIAPAAPIAACLRAWFIVNPLSKEVQRCRQHPMRWLCRLWTTYA